MTDETKEPKKRKGVSRLFSGFAKELNSPLFSAV